MKAPPSPQMPTTLDTATEQRQGARLVASKTVGFGCFFCFLQTLPNTVTVGTQCWGFPGPWDRSAHVLKLELHEFNPTRLPLGELIIRSQGTSIRVFQKLAALAQSGEVLGITRCSPAGHCGVNVASCVAESLPQGPATMSGDILGCLDWGCYWHLGVWGPGLLLTLSPCQAEGDSMLVVSPAVGKSG